MYYLYDFSSNFKNKMGKPENLVRENKVKNFEKSYFDFSKIILVKLKI